jgi:hypothetical protein
VGLTLAVARRERTERRHWRRGDGRRRGREGSGEQRGDPVARGGGEGGGSGTASERIGGIAARERANSTGDGEVPF